MSTSKQKRAIPVEKGLVFTSVGTVIPYPELETLLKRDHVVFVEDLKRQTAHQAAERISRRLKMKVFARAAVYGEAKGYAFYTIK